MFFIKGLSFSIWFILMTISFIKSENHKKNTNEMITYSKKLINNQLKSFTANCGVLDVPPQEIGYCTYSVSFLCDNGSYTGTASIQIDGVGKPFGINVNSALPIVYYNFAVVSGDEVTIDFDPITIIDNAVPYFKVYDVPNGNGTEILKSTSRTIVMPNECEGDCTFIMSNPSTVEWVSPACAVVKVNNGRRGIFTGIPIQFNVQKGDIITIEVRLISDGISYEISNDSIVSVPVIFSWYLDSYFTPALVDNQCNLYLPSPPFGSRLYPVLPEQLQTFLERNSAPISTKWSRLLPRKVVDYYYESKSESEVKLLY